jgi:hypothetical protein
MKSLLDVLARIRRRLLPGPAPTPSEPGGPMRVRKRRPAGAELYAVDDALARLLKPGPFEEPDDEEPRGN